jgi:hypothetical protein
MLVSQNLTKEFSNSMRFLQKILSSKNFRDLKYLITSIIKFKTLVLSHLFDENKVSSSKKKFVERISNMLAKLPNDIFDIIKNRSAKLTKKYSDNDIKIVSYD